jgi:two-component system nitrate/nitrite response regulator NarL
LSPEDHNDDRSTHTGALHGAAGGGGCPHLTLHLLVFVANEILGCGLDTVLSGLSIVESVRRARDDRELASMLRTEKFDILVVAATDLARLPVFRRPGRSAPAKVLVLVDDTHADNSGLLGSNTADGFLMQRNLSGESLRSALERICGGEVPMPAEIANELIARAADRAQSANMPAVVLTHREEETLELLAEGLSNQEIAVRLKVSMHGAKRLVARVLLKLGSPNRTSAVVTAIKYGMIDSK